MAKRQTIFALDPGSVNIGGAIVINGIPKKLFSIFGLVPRTKKTKGLFNDDMDALIRMVVPQFEDILSENNVTHVVWEIPPSFGSMGNREMVQAVCTSLKVITFQKKLFYNSFTPNYWHSQLLDKSRNVSKKDVRGTLLMKFPSLEKFNSLPPDPFDAAALGVVAHKIKQWKIA